MALQFAKRILALLPGVLLAYAFTPYGHMVLVVVLGSFIAGGIRQADQLRRSSQPAGTFQGAEVRTRPGNDVGAASHAGWSRNLIILNQRVADAPDNVRHPVLEHEWAHLRFQHTPLTLSLVMGIGAVLYANRGNDVLVVALAILGALLLWIDLAYAIKKNDATTLLLATALVTPGAAAWVAAVAGADIQPAPLFLWTFGVAGGIALTVGSVRLLLEVWADVAAARRSDLRPWLELEANRPRRIAGLLGWLEAHPPLVLRRAAARLRNEPAQDPGSPRPPQPA